MYPCMLETGATGALTAALGAGAVLGLAAGISPGPLMAFVLTQTLRHGTREGLKASLAPLLTDMPILAASIWAVHLLARSGPVLGILSLAGGLYLVFLAWETMCAPSVEAEIDSPAPRSLAKAVLVNILSPHPYLFWGTVGAPLVLDLHRKQPAAAWVFVIVFYVLLVGSKVLITLAVGRSRHLLTGKAYRCVMLSLGVVLAVFAVLLLWGGVSRLLAEPTA